MIKILLSDCVWKTLQNYGTKITLELHLEVTLD